MLAALRQVFVRDGKENIPAVDVIVDRLLADVHVELQPAQLDLHDDCRRGIVFPPNLLLDEIMQREVVAELNHAAFRPLVLLILRLRDVRRVPPLCR